MTRVNAIDRVLKAAVFAAAMSAALPPGAAAAPDGAGQRRPMLLQIMWDGARADCLENCCLTNLRKLAYGKWMPGYKGAWSVCGKPIEDARPYSYANHASLLNGVTAAKHDVYYNHHIKRCRVKEWPAWPTRLLDARPDLKVLYISPVWCLCADSRAELKRLRAGGAQNELAKADFLASRYASDAAPDAALLFLDAPDDSGHYEGFFPISSGYRKAVETNDIGLGKILDAIAARPTFDQEDWLIMMTSDHGGYYRTHGWLDDHSRTTPVILAGRHVVDGQMAGFPGGIDLPPTALAHFGIDVSKMNLDGRVIGHEAASWKAAPNLRDALTWYYPGENANRFCLDNAVPGGPGAQLIGNEQFFSSLRTNDTFFKTPFMSISGAEDAPCGARLEDSADMFVAPHPAFTISFWARLFPKEGNPFILGNKDFARAGSPGFVICQNGRTERSGKGVTVVYGTPEGRDVTVGTFDTEFDKWAFYAVVGTPEGQLWLYQGRSDGMFHWICGKAEKSLLGSGLPLHLGQDGTGTWKWNFDGFLDDVAIWRRPLEMREVKRIYDCGRKGQQLKDIAPVN